MEEAPDLHSVPFVEAPSDVEGALLSTVNDTESLGDGEEEFVAPEPEDARVIPATGKVSGVWIMLIWSICFRLGRSSGEPTVRPCAK